VVFCFFLHFGFMEEVKEVRNEFMSFNSLRRLLKETLLGF